MHLCMDASRCGHAHAHLRLCMKVHRPSGAHECDFIGAVQTGRQQHCKLKFQACTCAHLLTNLRVNQPLGSPVPACRTAFQPSEVRQNPQQQPKASPCAWTCRSHQSRDATNSVSVYSTTKAVKTLTNSCMAPAIRRSTLALFISGTGGNE